MSEKTDLNKIDTDVSNAVSALQELIDERTDAWSQKSVKWQESDKGQEHQERTDEMQSALDTLENAQAEIQALIPS